MSCPIRVLFVVLCLQEDRARCRTRSSHRRCCQALGSSCSASSASSPLSRPTASVVLRSVQAAVSRCSYCTIASVRGTTEQPGVCSQCFRVWRRTRIRGRFFLIVLRSFYGCSRKLQVNAALGKRRYLLQLYRLCLGQTVLFPLQVFAGLQHTSPPNL